MLRGIIDIYICSGQTCKGVYTHTHEHTHTHTCTHTHTHTHTWAWTRLVRSLKVEQVESWHFHTYLWFWLGSVLYPNMQAAVTRERELSSVARKRIIQITEGKNTLWCFSCTCTVKTACFSDILFIGLSRFIWIIYSNNYETNTSHPQVIFKVTVSMKNACVQNSCVHKWWCTE